MAFRHYINHYNRITKNITLCMYFTDTSFLGALTKIGWCNIIPQTKNLDKYVLYADILTTFFSGNPPQCNAWIGQCGLYILVMIIEKLLMTLLVLFDFWRDVSIPVLCMMCYVRLPWKIIKFQSVEFTILRDIHQLLDSLKISVRCFWN